jgi:hypothetical protein
VVPWEVEEEECWKPSERWDETGFQQQQQLESGVLAALRLTFARFLFRDAHWLFYHLHLFSRHTEPQFDDFPSIVRSCIRLQYLRIESFRKTRKHNLSAGSLLHLSQECKGE